MSKSHRQVLTALVAFAAVTALTQIGWAGEWTDTEVFVDADRAASLIEEGATVVDAREAPDYQRGHIPGAAHLHWQQFVDGPTSGALIEDDERLETKLKDAGIDADQPVVVYGAWNDDGWGEEGRIHWMLEHLGHEDVRLLIGGLRAWNRAGHPVSTQPETDRTEGSFTVERRDERRISTDELTERLETSEAVRVVDTRQHAEYRGEAKFGERRGGHIPGATHLWWQELVDDHGLVDRQTVREKLDRRGIDNGDTVVTYCTGGVRSGFVYAVLRAEGIDVRNYDASMWEWTRHDDHPVDRIEDRRVN